MDMVVPKMDMVVPKVDMAVNKKGLIFSFCLDKGASTSCSVISQLDVENTKTKPYLKKNQNPLEKIDFFEILRWNENTKHVTSKRKKDSKVGVPIIFM